MLDRQLLFFYHTAVAATATLLLLLLLVRTSSSPTEIFAMAATTITEESFGPLTTIPSEKQMKQCTSLIVMLHGLGDRGEGWKNQFTSYQRNRPGVCVLLPTAANILVEFSGQKMNSWYGISKEKFQNWNIDANVDEVDDSAEYIVGLAKNYMRRFNIPWKKVLFAGFSQGASMSLHIGTAFLTSEADLAGLVSVGGFLAAESAVVKASEKKRMNKNVPILLIHGHADRVVVIERANRALDVLKKAGVKSVTMKTDEKLAHSLNEKMWKEMQQFMDEKLGLSSSKNSSGDL